MVAIAAEHEITSILQEAFSEVDDFGRIGTGDGAEVALEEQAEMGEFLDGGGVATEVGHAFGVGEDDGEAAILQPFDGVGGPGGPIGSPDIDEDVGAVVAVGGDTVALEIGGDGGGEAEFAAGAEFEGEVVFFDFAGETCDEIGDDFRGEFGEGFGAAVRGAEYFAIAVIGHDAQAGEGFGEIDAAVIDPGKEVTVDLGTEHGGHP